MSETDEERAARHALDRPLVEAFNTIARQANDERLVEEAIRRHAVEMLRLSVHKPQPGEIFPAMPYAMATWHLLRINALRAAPVDVAAAQLREETLNALDTTRKDR